MASRIPSSRVISPMKNFPRNTRVVDEFFSHKAQAILSIPLSSRRTSDMLVQRGTKNGTYSTKKAYRMLHEAELASKSRTLNCSAQGVFQKEIWNLNIPSKLKHFLSRACNDSLPTKKNLFRRKVTQNSIYECYHEGVEDSIPTLWDC